jgi:hypothetical protein
LLSISKFDIKHLIKLQLVIVIWINSQYFSIKLGDRFGYLSGQADSLFKIPEHGVDVGLSVPMDKPTGVIALTHARIITMRGNEVIENGTIIIRFFACTCDGIMLHCVHEQKTQQRLFEQ